ncbi:hemolysin family protein [Desulfurobacterium atlanticum]|uniref:Hemolysin, contains CBS domains n=1 Tax=Desulfurobacterium atlanticum TaxID=240169 RepID=A0A238ZFM8_9BACT|nr:hemolysin family protein [Desulfurobacterium atlanticum]SNR82315.1 Hemolysin, contains CBS domains [Desulfurobacterium atlanticum]
MSIFYILAIFCCIAFEAFFSGSEIAIISVSRVELKKRLKKGDRAAVLLNELLKEPEKILATTLIGTNVATVTAATLFTTYIVSYYADIYPFVREYPELFTVISLTPLTITFGELIPKSLFQKYSDKIAFKIVYPLYFFHRIFRPLGMLVTFVAKLLTDLVGDRSTKNPFVTKEELELLVESASRSAFEKTERKILKNVLRLKEKTLGDIYVPLVNVVAVNLNSRVKEALRLFNKTGFSKLPVYKERFDDIVGYILITDLLDVDDKYASVKRFMRPILILPEYMNLLDAMKEFKKAKTQMAAVVDEFGSTLGIVTIEDILEEIVGKIDDEFGSFESKVKKLSDGSLIVDGNIEIAEVNRFLKTSLPVDGDYVTVAGFILKTLGRFPKKGEVIKYHNVELKIEDVEKKRIKKVRIKEH